MASELSSASPGLLVFFSWELGEVLLMPGRKYPSAITMWVLPAPQEMAQGLGFRLEGLGSRV